LNVYPSRPAECVSFRERFTDAATVALNGGTAVGSPTFDNGAELDGVSDYVTYTLPGNPFTSSDLSIAIEFVPRFNYDEDAIRCMLDSTAGSRYLVLKSNTANNHAIQVWLGNTSVTSVFGTVYGQYWRKNKKNTLLVSGRSGHTNVYLNGHQVVTKDASAWSPALPATIYLGASNVGSWKFWGKLLSVSVLATETDLNDSIAYENGDHWQYAQKARAWLDTKSNLTNVDGYELTKDKTRFGHDFWVGDGTTAANKPTYQNPGYRCDGSNDFLSSRHDLYNSLEQSIVVAFRPEFIPEEDSVRYLFDSSLGARYLALKTNTANSNTLQVWLGNSSIVSIPLATYLPAWYTGGINVLAVCGRSADTCAMLNCKEILAHDTSAWTPQKPDTIYIGSNYTKGQGFGGDILHYSTYQTKLTPMQIRDLTARILSAY
jgi:hypothetical protein